MSRPLRIEFEGAFYHVTTRGDRGEPIFEDEGDRHALLSVIEHGINRYDATVFAYCLMGNHFHLVLQTRKANLSRLMRHINGIYTQRYNVRHDKTGHVFQGRYCAILIERDSYFLEACRYVDLNPVRARLVASPADWSWSSYRAHVGHQRWPLWLDSETLYRHLAPASPTHDGPRRYAEFVAQGSGMSLWDSLVGARLYLGSETFWNQVQRKAEAVTTPEIPSCQRHPAQRPLTEYLTAYGRNEAIARAHLDGHYSQKSIAEATRLSGSRISRLIAAHEAKGKT